MWYIDDLTSGATCTKKRWDNDSKNTALGQYINGEVFLGSFCAFLNVFGDFDIAIDFFPFRLCRIYHRPKRFWDCAKGRSENVEKSSRPVGIAGVKHLPLAGYRTKSWSFFWGPVSNRSFFRGMLQIVEGSWTSTFWKHECDVLPQTLDPEAILIGATNLKTMLCRTILNWAGIQRDRIDH